MTTTFSEIPVGEPFDLGDKTVGLDRTTRLARFAAATGGPARIDGLTIGAPFVRGDPPHGGEMHPDGMN